MSIWLYTGTPGSGKSYHAACDISRRLKAGGGVIANFPINEAAVKKCKAHCEYWDNSELSAKKLIQYAMEHHKIGVEGQCLVVIDECQIIFNCREFGRKDRTEWITFFSQHRKLGYNVILITQSDRMLDKQIRSLVESEVKHRKLGNYGIMGWLVSLLFGGTLFITIEYWYGGNKLMIGKNFIKFHKRKEAIYDSYRMFSDIAAAGSAAAVPGGTACGGAPGNDPAEPPAIQAVTSESCGIAESVKRRRLLRFPYIHISVDMSPACDWIEAHKDEMIKLDICAGMFVAIMLFCG